MKLQVQDETGIVSYIPEPLPPVDGLRLTIPAREALMAVGATVVPTATEPVTYTVTLGETVPDGLVAFRLSGASGLAVRMEHEPAYPGEIKSYWDQLFFKGCPVCGAPLLWYEAGYVPGYRVCARPPHHHVLAQ